MSRKVRSALRRGRLRRRYLAIALIEGPHTIFPPDRAKMLEMRPVLQFILGGYPSDTSSVALYCDSTVNRHSRFDAPLVRVAIWNRETEATNMGPWPQVAVRWGRLRRGKRRVRDFVRRLIRHLGKGPIVVDGGIFTRYGHPRVSTIDYEHFYKLMLRTRLQEIRLHSPGLAGDPLLDMVRRGSDLLQELMEPSTFRGWAECYDRDICSPNLVKSSHWCWDGKVPKRDPGRI